MSVIEIVFETHSTTGDNEAGRATGWLAGRLSPAGEQDAAALGRRRREDGLAAVFCSDLARAVQTADIAFACSSVPVPHDWRLRECDYGELNGGPAERVVGARSTYIDEPYPGGESWRQATARVGRFLQDLPLRWTGSRVLVIGHVATRWGLECALQGADLRELIAADFRWQEGWEYRPMLRLPGGVSG